MKSKFLFVSLLASMLFTGCSQEEFVPTGGENGDATTNYLTVTLRSSDPATSRAAEPGYEDGSTAENKISKIRFYFFTETGAPANVKLLGTNYVNYYDWTPADGDQVPDPGTNDIESHLKTATIVISTKNGDKLPTRMAAVINPTETTVPSRSLQELKNVTNDYAKNSLTTEGNFVMFNSVYRADGQEVCAVPITSENLAKTPDDARANPVTIYVERNVAKVTVNIGNEAGFNAEGLLALKDKNGADIKVNGEQVYLEINGWTLAAETSVGRLGKKINTEWDMTWWQPANKFRSCWAINASSAVNRYFDLQPASLHELSEALYTNENAEDYTNSAGETTNLNRTKVVLRGTLYNAAGNTLTIVRHLGAHFADEVNDEDESKNLPLLKQNILSQLAANGHHYYTPTADGRRQIDINDIKIVTLEQETEEDSENNCFVCAQLTVAAAALPWYDTTDEAQIEPNVPAANLNAALMNKDVVDHPLVWKNGMTYYYYEIIHNGNTKGVVRNHVYKTTVTKIAGLGTPIYDPELVVYPEKPDPNDHYIAAQINILSWHIVSNNYELEW